MYEKTDKKGRSYSPLSKHTRVKTEERYYDKKMYLYTHGI